VKVEMPNQGQANASSTIGHDGLVNGPATLVVNAGRKTFFGLRTVNSRVTRTLEVRLDPPRVSVVSIHHFINLGGAEFVVLRATPEDVEAGTSMSATPAIASIPDQRSASPIRLSASVFFALAARSGCRCADQRLRARCRRQRGEDAARA
jgi:hypothetical protein